MEQKAKRVGKFNIVDIIAVILIVAVVAFAGYKLLGNRGSGVAVEPDMTKVTYVVRVEGVAAELYEHCLENLPSPLMASGALVGGQIETVEKLSSLAASISKSVRELENQVSAASEMNDLESLARIYRDLIVTKMDEVRSYCDEAEFMTSAEHWPYPVYSELLFGII